MNAKCASIYFRIIVLTQQYKVPIEEIKVGIDSHIVKEGKHG
jgi:hypothetical protein